MRGFTVSRLIFIPFTAGKSYFLRLLFCNFLGATFYEFLRTIYGVVYSTFRVACVATGLLKDNNYWVFCFKEASL